MPRWRLTVLTALLLSLVFGLAVSQTVLSSALQELRRYFRAATMLIANTVSRVDTVQEAQIPQSDRGAIRDEMKKISFELSVLHSEQAPLIFDLSEYVSNVRAGELVGERRENAWKSILLSVNRVAILVNNTLNIVETSRWLKVTLDEQDRLALREVLLGRASLLKRLRSLPTPGTPDDIDQLDETNKFYRELWKSLGELNAALTRASERLKLE